MCNEGKLVNTKMYKFESYTQRIWEIIPVEIRHSDTREKVSSINLKLFVKGNCIIYRNLNEILFKKLINFDM